MEPLGATTSILTLVATVISVGRIVVRLKRSIQDAPTELNNIIVQLSTIEAQLKYLAGIESEYEIHKINEQYQPIVENALDQLRQAMLTASGIVLPLRKRSNLQLHLRRTICDQAQVSRLSQVLEKAQQNLGLALQILNL